MKLKFTLFMLAVIVATIPVNGQFCKVNLYPEGAIPNYMDAGESEQWDSTDIVRVGLVQMPDIAVFLPSKKSRTGEAVIICPGGGYHRLSYDWEGEDVAKFWNSKGIAAIVLKYRLPVSKAQAEPWKSPLMDAKRAMRMVRYHAPEWGIDPHRIGIMGFSAGGHLASSLSTHFDTGDPGAQDPIERVSSRPDFAILVYPVITFTGDFQHSGSRKALVGENVELMEYFSSELQVTPETPPTFLVHAADDRGVPPENSIVYFQALQKNKVPVEMHIYPQGGHGFSLGIGKGHLAEWPERAYVWLESLRE